MQRGCSRGALPAALLAWLCLGIILLVLLLLIAQQHVQDAVIVKILQAGLPGCIILQAGCAAQAQGKALLDMLVALRPLRLRTAEGHTHVMQEDRQQGALS